MTKLESPSLRGSGLKLSYRVIANAGDFVSLFTREWIEILMVIMRGIAIVSSPSLRGSGLKYPHPLKQPPLSESPSLRGSGLKFRQEGQYQSGTCVSLFTREWIEIIVGFRSRCRRSLPLYEGVD